MYTTNTNNFQRTLKTLHIDPNSYQVIIPKVFSLSQDGYQHDPSYIYLEAYAYFMSFLTSFLMYLQLTWLLWFSYILITDAHKLYEIIQDVKHFCDIVANEDFRSFFILIIASHSPLKGLFIYFSFLKSWYEIHKSNLITI